MIHRSIGDGPFCWQTKEALRRIHDHFSETNNVPSAYAVYTALSLIASDEQRDTFTIKKSLIAFRAGLSVRSVDVVLAGLQTIGLLHVQTQRLGGSKLKAPSIYTLLPVSNGRATISNHCLSSGNGCRSIGNGRLQPSVAEKVEESGKNPSEESLQERAGAREEGEETWGEVAFNIPALDDPPAALLALPGFADVWEAFGYMRQEGHNPLTEHAAERLVDKLIQRPADAVEALWLAVENRWQGFEWEWIDEQCLTGTGPGAPARVPGSPSGHLRASPPLPAPAATPGSEAAGTRALSPAELRAELGPCFGLDPASTAGWTPADRRVLRQAGGQVSRADAELVKRAYRLPERERRDQGLFLPRKLPQFIDRDYWGDNIGRLRTFFGQGGRAPTSVAPVHRDVAPPLAEPAAEVNRIQPGED